MESLGEILKTTRENKGYTFDQVSRDTNIVSRYLKALEAEDFSKFPGEAYIIGFLRTYGDYLGLDSQDLLAKYRSLKIQELPTPVEELLRPPSILPKIIRIGVIAAAGLLVIGGGILFFSRLPKRETIPEEDPRVPEEYAMDEPTLERRLYQGDSVLIVHNALSYKITVDSLGEAVAIGTPAGQAVLDLSQDTSIDLDSDGLGDLRITAADFVRNEPSTGVLLRFVQESAGGSEIVQAPGTAAPAQTPGSSTVPAAMPPSSGASPAQIVFTSPNAYPFTLQLLFQGYCMFRYEILAERDRQGRNERYYQRGEEFNIPAQNGIRLWISNTAAVRIQAIGGGRTVPLELGGAGEVAVWDIRWIRDEDGRFRLALVKLD